QHLLRLQEMTYIRPRIPAAGRTLAALLDRALIQLIFRVEEISLSLLCVHVSMAPVSAGIDAVKEVHTPVYRLQYIGRRPYSHEIDRLILGKVGYDRIQYAVHLLMGLTHGKSPHGIAVQVHGRDLLRVS